MPHFFTESTFSERPPSMILRLAGFVDQAAFPAAVKLAGRYEGRGHEWQRALAIILDRPEIQADTVLSNEARRRPLVPYTSGSGPCFCYTLPVCADPA